MMISITTERVERTTIVCSPDEAQAALTSVRGRGYAVLSSGASLIRHPGTDRVGTAVEYKIVAERPIGDDPFELIRKIKAAHDTEEDGDNLVEVCRDAHNAQLREARRHV